MKVQKLNKELLSIYYKKDKRVYAQLVKDKVYVTDTYRAWIIKNEDFLIDVDKLKKVNLDKFFNDDGYEPAVKTNELKQMNDFVGVYVTNEDGSVKALINKKYFDVFENYTLKIKSDTLPIFVYEHEELIALVLPAKVY